MLRCMPCPRLHLQYCHPHLVLALVPPVRFPGPADQPGDGAVGVARERRAHLFFPTPFGGFRGRALVLPAAGKSHKVQREAAPGDDCRVVSIGPSTHHVACLSRSRASSAAVINPRGRPRFMKRAAMRLSSSVMPSVPHGTSASGPSAPSPSDPATGLPEPGSSSRGGRPMPAGTVEAGCSADSCGKGTRDTPRAATGGPT